MFELINQFENKIAEFFGSPYAVATDSCTHVIELCLRHTKANFITIPTRTYISVPFTAMKLSLDWNWDESEWQDYYFLGNTNIVDSAVLWKKDSYIPGTYMNLSFQFKKHLNLGRGGMILTDNKMSYDTLKKMAHDGRTTNIPWAKQDITDIGYHYHMTPETAQLGLHKLESAIQTVPKQWTITEWPDLSKMSVFANSNS
jgi:dTDP-4-amino-4,6-dideoxygalactose transaminase